MTRFAPVEIDAWTSPDGSTTLSNRLRPPPATQNMADRLEHWAARRPDRTFMSEPGPSWRRAISYRDAGAAMLQLAERLPALDLSGERPLMLVGANGINHGLVSLAAMRAGLPVAIISPASCGPTAAPWAKFHDLLELLTPGMILADDPAALGPVLASSARPGVPVGPLLDLSWLYSLAGQAAPPPAAGTRMDEPAKLLLTSGSTGRPKAVVNTHRMMMSNMLALELVWPFLLENPPVLVDWLPWNHTFGGNCCFNLCLHFGGTFHIDDGKPLPGLVDRTADLLRILQPSVYFNVPGGYDALLPYLEADLALATRFFSGLDFLFNAAAAMPESTRARLEACARRSTGAVPPIVGGWGATETAPFSTVIYFETDHSANIGVPLPGTQIKLVPDGGRTELRVRGPNVMPGYWRDPDATARAFDEEGFYRIGDAGRLADPGRPEKGLLFDGRLAENFKLGSGTWVNVGALRLDVIAAAGGLIRDAVVAGEGRDEVGLLLLLDEPLCRELLGAGAASLDAAAILGHPLVVGEIEARIGRFNARQTGASRRVGRFLVLLEPPRADRGEITEKGYLNQRMMLERRAAEVEALYADGGYGDDERGQAASLASSSARLVP